MSPIDLKTLHVCVPVSFNLLTTFFRSLHGRCTGLISLFLNQPYKLLPIFSSSQWSLFAFCFIVSFTYEFSGLLNLSDTHYLTVQLVTFLASGLLNAYFNRNGYCCTLHSFMQSIVTRLATSALLVGLIQMKYLYSNLDMLKIAWEFEVLRLMSKNQCFNKLSGQLVDMIKFQNYCSSVVL